MEYLYGPEAFMLEFFRKLNHKAEGRLEEFGYKSSCVHDKDGVIIQIAKKEDVPLEIVEAFQANLIHKEDVFRMEKSFKERHLGFNSVTMFGGKVQVRSYQFISPSKECATGYEKSHINTVKIEGLPLSDKLMGLLVKNII